MPFNLQQLLRFLGLGKTTSQVGLLRCHDELEPYGTRACITDLDDLICFPNGILSLKKCFPYMWAPI